MSNHTYNYSPSCYVCNGLFDQTQLPKENTTAECPTIMNDYICMRYGDTTSVPNSSGRMRIITHTKIDYRHRFHGEPGERPYKM
jgi:hypothetical protein